eukprot:4574174-Amphidinium_carterae.1
MEHRGGGGGCLIPVIRFYNLLPSLDCRQEGTMYGRPLGVPRIRICDWSKEEGHRPEKQQTTTNTNKTKRKTKSFKSIGIHQNTGKVSKTVYAN